MLFTNLFDTRHCTKGTKDTRNDFFELLSSIKHYKSDEYVGYSKLCMMYLNQRKNIRNM